MLRELTAALLVFATSAVYAQTEAETAAAGDTAISALTVSDFELNTAADLVDICGVIEDHPDYEVAHTFCIGFVTGAIHYHREVAAGPNMGAIVCPDRPIPREMLIQTFLTWSAANPELSQGAPVVNIIRAAADQWPCQR